MLDKESSAPYFRPRDTTATVLRSTHYLEGGATGGNRDQQAVREEWKEMGEERKGEK